MDVNEHEVAKCDRKFVRELRCEGSCPFRILVDSGWSLSLIEVDSGLTYN